jgi:hypothetical protein
MTNERVEVLRSTVALSRTIAELKRAVSSLPWDSPTAQVSLTNADVSSVLQRYLDGAISSSDVEEWANLIEGREDIGFESECAEALAELLNELANPVTMGALTSQRAQTWLRRLGS